MAANIMVDVLKQLQRDVTDQKDYMRNLHVIHRNINEKFNMMSEKMSELNIKVDKQQVTLERLEQQVSKNNRLLFGNDETEINLDDLAIVAYKPDLDKIDLADQPEKYAENKENSLNPSEVYGEHKNKNNDLINVSDGDKGGELFDNNEDIEKEVNDSNEQTIQISPPLNAEQITQLRGELKQFMHDLSKMKEFLIETLGPKKIASEEAEVAATVQSSDKETPTSIDNHEADPMSPLYTELFSHIKCNLKQMMSEIKEFISEMVATKRVEEAPSPVGEQKTVRISPTYFSAHQIQMLNADLKKISEKYQSASVFPIIEVIPGPAEDHDIMKRLEDGIQFFQRQQQTVPSYYYIKLGLGGFQRAIVQDLITDYPNLNFRDVVEHVLRSQNEWKDFIAKYAFR